jgi:hypothetical protein
MSMLLPDDSKCQPEWALWAGGNIWNSPARKTRKKMLVYKV